tara:strand:+ start:5080 stop:6537 length:1458 start_codon:yes stop_codon:yes gene_type:complete
MAGSLASTPGFNLQPSAERVATSTNYLTDFNFLNQYLPDVYEAEFERYGNRTISSFLRMVGAEMPTNSDLIKWSEQGRLHIKYDEVQTESNPGTKTSAITFKINDSLTALGFQNGQIALREGQTVMISDNTPGSTLSNKGVIVAEPSYASSPPTISVALYEADQVVPKDTNLSLFVYGSEFKKGTSGMNNSLEADGLIFDNKPIIIKDRYSVSGSDMAQIGWIEISTEDGGTGYLWYLKSEHETRLRFEDYLETALVEAVPAADGSGAENSLGFTSATKVTAGTEGVFHAVENRGNVWSGGNPTTLSDFDAVIQRLDKQGAIEENVLFLNRQFSFDIDDMLAAQNSYGAGGTSYGLFDNDEEMALNLGFSGFRRGYDFYKTDWKYLNDPTLRGGLVGGAINGLLVPAGSTTVYDQVLGKNATRPFLHVRYRASETENRRYKTFIVGSAGMVDGRVGTSLDAMEVHFLSERAVCVMGANNFFIFKG